MKDDISSSQLRMESGKKVGELLPAETEEEVTFSNFSLLLVCKNNVATFFFPKKSLISLVEEEVSFSNFSTSFLQKEILPHVF